MAEYARPLEAALESVDASALPAPEEGVRWLDITSAVGGHLPAKRLERAGFVTYATAHEERVGEVDAGGLGLYRTTDDLFNALQTIDSD